MVDSNSWVRSSAFDGVALEAVIAGPGRVLSRLPAMIADQRPDDLEVTALVGDEVIRTPATTVVLLADVGDDIIASVGFRPGDGIPDSDVFERIAALALRPDTTVRRSFGARRRAFEPPSVIASLGPPAGGRIGTFRDHRVPTTGPDERNICTFVKWLCDILG